MKSTQPITWLSGVAGSAHAPVGASRPFVARFVRPGETGGPNDNARLEGQTPVIEIFDATHEGDEKFNPLGQFVTSYYADDIARLVNNSKTADLCLDGGQPQWSLSSAAVYKLGKWAKAKMIAFDIDHIPVSTISSKPAGLQMQL